jgi:hypothetical protein
MIPDAASIVENWRNRNDEMMKLRGGIRTCSSMRLSSVDRRAEEAEKASNLHRL